MKKPGVDKRLEKENILVMLGVKIDFSKLGYLAKMDIFYLNLVACRIFTDA